MGIDLNVFRLLGDLSHTASKITLITAIHRNSSAEGVSLLTQMLYFLVFSTRYLDLFWVAPWFSYWNTVLKIFYISSSVYVVYIMMRWFPRTREKEKAWKITTGSLGGSLIAAPLVTMLFRGWSGSTLSEVRCSLSRYLSRMLTTESRFSGPSASSSKASASFPNCFSSAKPQSRQC